MSLSFPVTWRFLSEYGAPPESEPKIEHKQAPPPPLLQEVVKATAVIPPPAVQAIDPGPMNDTWEMVIPRMSRPEKRSKSPVAVDPPKAVKPAPAHPHTPAVESNLRVFSAVAEPVQPKIPVFALVAVGFMWVRMVKVAQAKLPQANGDARFYDTKIRTARFYMTKLLPQVNALFLTIMAGSAPLMDIDADAF